MGGGVYTAGPHLEGVLIVSGPKLPKTGGKSTDDPLVIARDNDILVNVYTQPAPEDWPTDIEKNEVIIWCLIYFRCAKGRVLT